MAKSIVWSKRAVNHFNAIAEYLEFEWGTKVAENFAQQTYGILATLAEFPDMGTLEEQEEGIRCFMITKHNRLFYRYTEKQLIVLAIFDTRQNPNSKQLLGIFFVEFT